MPQVMKVQVFSYGELVSPEAKQSAAEHISRAGITDPMQILNSVFTVKGTLISDEMLAEMIPVRAGGPKASTPTPASSDGPDLTDTGL